MLPGIRLQQGSRPQPLGCGGSWLEHTTCLLAKTSVPHDSVPPPPASPQPGAVTASQAKGCGSSRGRSVGERGVGEHRGYQGLEGTRGMLTAGEALEGPRMKLPLLNLEATSHCKLGWNMGRGPHVLTQVTTHSWEFALAPDRVLIVGHTNLWPSRITI